MPPVIPAMTPDTPPARGTRIPAIDTLRGAAIVLVVGYHFVPVATAEPIGRVLWSVLRAGWVGVDLFLVLSGYLITGILLDARARLDARPVRETLHFFCRRAIRIMPAYYLLLVVLLLVHAIRAVHGDAAEGGTALVQDQWWYWLFVSNVRIAMHGEWTTAAWVEHLWSLAVEEQFYLLWPLLLITTPQRRLPLVLAVLLPLALTCRVAAVATGEPLAAYVLMPARCDALGLGAIVALLHRSPHRHEVTTRFAVAGMLASAAALSAVLAANGPRAHSIAMATIGHTLWSLLFASLLWLAIVPPKAAPAQAGLAGGKSRWSLTETIRARWQAALAERRLLRWLSTYSYGIYLVHLPVRSALEHMGLTPRALFPDWGWWPGTIVGLSLGLGLSVGLALASWRLVENPMQAFGRSWLSAKVSVGHVGATFRE